MRPFIVLFALALTFVGVSSASAVPFNASYTDSNGGVIAFMFEGTIQQDGDIVVVDSMIMNPTYNGVDPLIQNALFQSFSAGFLGQGGPALLSFSGNVLDFLWSDPQVAQGFFLQTVTTDGFEAVSSSDEFGQLDEGFEPDNWSLTLKSDIPEPATASLGLMSLAGLVLRRRRMA